jgi:diguanylate cyclase (GGDEF)-like protein
MNEFASLPVDDLEHFVVQRSKASSALPTGPDIARVFRQILQKAAELVPSQGGAILLDDPLEKNGPDGEGQLHFVAGFGEPSRDLIGSSIPARGGVAGHVYRTGTAHLSVTTEEDETFLPEIDAITGFATESMIAAPILIGTTVCGVIELRNRTNGRPYDAHDLLILEVFASYTASSLQNALEARHAQELAKIDDLTGLYNDRYLHVRLREELAHSAATGAPCALIFMDLDHFKPVNDEHGHLVGSQVLREVGYLLRRATAGFDAILARYGGDEFTIVLPGRTAEAAEELADRLRTVIAGAVFMSRSYGPDLPALHLRNAITASFGVADTLDGSHAEGVDSAVRLIREADQAMYAAKAAGRDRVVIATPHSPPLATPPRKP